nr:ribonuclease H-like domain-containing protein [Tanacetum cinerariifolium]
YQEFNGGSVAFRGSNGRITGKGKIKADRLDFEDVYYVGELKHYNRFSVSQMCNKKNKGNLVRGLPSKIFKNDHTCIACQKGKQHKAFCPQEANNSAGTQANDDQGAHSEEIDLHDEHFVLPIWSAYSNTVKSSGDTIEKNKKPDANTNSTNILNVVSAPVSAVGPSIALNDDEPSYPDDPSMPHLEDIHASPSAGIFTNSSYDDEGTRKMKWEL